MLKFFIYFGVLCMVQCVFFDLTDIDDPASFFFNNRVTTQATGICTVRNIDGSVTQGRCIHAAKCFLSRGTTRGSCGFGGSCCVYEAGCNTETREKVSYFSGSYRGISNSLQNSLCTHKIHLMPNTCQLRLDFQRFLFEPPTPQTTTSGTTTGVRYRCSNDSLTVSPNHYLVPQLCGDNNNQHVYVHLNRTVDSTVLLEISLADRSSSSVTYSVANPEWNIKITQLECKTTFDVFHHNKNSIDDDLRMLAPLGALQYFTDISGTFRTLGIRDVDMIGTTPRTMANDPFTYINNLRYSIAFKRYPNVCGVQFTTRYMSLQDSSTLTTCNTDFIFAPEATTNSKWCTLTTIHISPPGPLYIYFSSLPTYPSVHQNTYGFKVDYHLEGCESPIN